jgi:PIN domain nuclease of toxin-antitoxin system
MTLSLDTNVLIRWLSAPESLSREAHSSIADGNNVVFVSAVCVWEMEIKSGIGKLIVPDGIEEQLAADNLVELPVRIAHARELRNLSPIHRDPFDRLLIAQARSENLTLVTCDAQVLAYGGKMLKA